MTKIWCSFRQSSQREQGISFGYVTFEQEVRLKKLQRQGFHAGFCEVRIHLSKPVDKAVTVDTSVENKTLPKDEVLQTWVMENYGRTDRSTKQYEEICTVDEITKVTFYSKKNHEVSE